MSIECSGRTRADFRKVRRRHALTSDQMGMLNIFDGSGALMIGFFGTAFIYERIVPLAPPTQLLQLTVLVIALSLPLLGLVDWIFSSELAYAAWRDNESWCVLMMQCGSMLRTTCFFLCTHFAFALLRSNFTASRCSLLECLALIPVTVVLFHLFVRVMRPSSSR